MKTVILIVGLLDSLSDIAKMKKHLIRYFGERMIEEIEDLVPGICLKTEISKEDIKALEQIIKEQYEANVNLIFITSTEEKLKETKYTVNLTL